MVPPCLTPVSRSRLRNNEDGLVVLGVRGLVTTTPTTCRPGDCTGTTLTRNVNLCQTTFFYVCRSLKERRNTRDFLESNKHTPLHVPMSSVSRFSLGLLVVIHPTSCQYVTLWSIVIFTCDMYLLGIVG